MAKFRGTPIQIRIAHVAVVGHTLIVLAGRKPLDIPWRDKWAPAQAKQGTALVSSHFAEMHDTTHLPRSREIMPKSTPLLCCVRVKLNLGRGVGGGRVAVGSGPVGLPQAHEQWRF